MMRHLLLVLPATLCLLNAATAAEVVTIAGTGEDRYFGDGGPAIEAGVGGPFGVAI